MCDYDVTRKEIGGFLFKLFNFNFSSSMNVNKTKYWVFQYI